jgi:hypothetical protein
MSKDFRKDVTIVTARMKEEVEKNKRKKKKKEKRGPYIYMKDILNLL